MSYVNFRGSFVVVLLIRTLRFSHSEFEGKVVGGQETSIRKFPHAVYLNAHCNSKFICGASIINQKILLTAAHCVNDCNLKRKYHAIESYGGHEDVSTKGRIVLRFVVSAAVHNDYDEDEVLNDIALLKVNKNFPLNANIKKVIIPKRFPNNKKAAVAGWGLTSERTRQSSKVLKSVTQSLGNEKICARLGQLHAGMFCAGSLNATDAHPANGDSGSAFITSDFQQIGLVSFRMQSMPALMVYSNVTYYFNWIQNRSKSLYCNKD